MLTMSSWYSSPSQTPEVSYWTGLSNDLPELDSSIRRYRSVLMDTLRAQTSPLGTSRGRLILKVGLELGASGIAPEFGLSAGTSGWLIVSAG